MIKTTFITAHEAALRGLPAGVRGDQALVHGSGSGIAFGAARAVLAPCNVHSVRNDVGPRICAACSLGLKNNQPACNHGLDGAFLRLGARIALLIPSLQGEKPLLCPCEAGEVVFHLSPLLLCGRNLGDQIIKADNPAAEIDNASIPIGWNANGSFDGLRYGGLRDIAAQEFAEISGKRRLPSWLSAAPEFEFHAVRLAFTCSYVKPLLILFLVVSRHG